MSYFYGVSGDSDAYLISLMIPTTVFGFVATGISTGYIPVYSRTEGGDVMILKIKQKIFRK